MPALDFENPHDRLRGLVRLRGRENGGCWLWFGGTVYGRPPGQALEPLFRFDSVLFMEYEDDGDGRQVFRQRESCLFSDLATGEAQGVFANPYTGKDNRMVGYVSPIFAFRFAADGTAPYGKGKTPLRESRMQPDLAFGGGDIWSTEWRRNEFMTAPRTDEFPDAAPGGRSRKSVDVATYRATAEAISDGDTPFVPAQLTFLADVPWLQWMFMGERDGHMMWSGTGLKTKTSDGLPDEIRRQVDAHHPGFLDDPFGMDGAPFGTMAQLRALKAEGKL